MCPSCDGLGHLYSFDPELLIPDDEPFVQAGLHRDSRNVEGSGALATAHLSRCGQHGRAAQGPAGRGHAQTPWCELDSEAQRYWLWGTGNRHITYTWRGGASPMKYGGKYEGIIPELLGKYRSSKSRPQLRKLEKYMRTLPCSECDGQRLVQQARFVRIATQHASFQESPSLSLPEVCHLPVRDAAAYFEELDLNETGQLIAAEVLKEIRNRLGVPAERGTRLPDLGSDRADPVRWRIATDSAGQPDRFGTGRRVVHPGRAFDRLASARQRSVARHAASTCATWAIRWWWSNMMKRRCARPTT